MKIKNKIVSCIITILTILPFFSSFSQKSNIKYIDEFNNANHPQILYWQWDDHTITDRQYIRDIDKIADKSPFDLIFLTSRFSDSIGFYNAKKMQPYLKEAVEHAHKRGIKIALQLWPINRTRELFMSDCIFEKEDAQILVAEASCKLNQSGSAILLNQSTSARFNKQFASELLRVYLFRETSQGEYEPSTLIEADPQWLNAKCNPDYSISVTINAPTKYAGYTAYALSSHYYNYYDIFSPKTNEMFKKMLDDYSDIPFDGTGLDENGAMGIKPMWNAKPGEYMTERPWGKHFSSFLQEQIQLDPVRLLFDMQYAPEGNPGLKIKAINTYFANWQKGSIAVEKYFYDYSKKLFGKNCFMGLHSTFHNSLDGDDIWTTGVSWWDIPREYGQTDETQPMPDRMGIGLSGIHPVMYNMFYHKDKKVILREALGSARFGVRTHYHGWNDSQGWGKNLEHDDFLEDVRPIENRVRMLNRFDPVAPKLPLLVIYNFPYQFNWYPDSTMRSALNIRKCNMQGVASQIWSAGYFCATIPDTWLEKGYVTVLPDGKVDVRGRQFDAVVFLNPEYLRATSFSFMEELTRKNGKLMIHGHALTDFDGNDCRERFNKISEKAIPFSIENIAQLGVIKNNIPDGIYLTDGSVVMSNYQTVADKTSKEFEININGHTFQGSYQGVFSLKVNKKGKIEKMACGNFQSLKRNGKEILSLKDPADIVILGKKITIKGEEISNKLQITDAF